MAARELLDKLRAIIIMPLWMPFGFIAMRDASFRADCQLWGKWLKFKPSYFNICKLFTTNKEFRNLFYKRSKLALLGLSWLLPGYDHLHLAMPSENIGPGLLIQHGFATIVNAARVGKNFKVYQQVTVGYNHQLQAPVIGDNVEVCCGAKIIGGVRIGNNVIVGANAVVIDDVPDNCVVAGIPAKIVRKLDPATDILNHLC